MTSLLTTKLLINIFTRINTTVFKANTLFNWCILRSMYPQMIALASSIDYCIIKYISFTDLFSIMPESFNQF